MSGPPRPALRRRSREHAGTPRTARTSPRLAGPRGDGPSGWPTRDRTSRRGGRARGRPPAGHISRLLRIRGWPGPPRADRSTPPGSPGALDDRRHRPPALERRRPRWSGAPRGAAGSRRASRAARRDASCPLLVGLGSSEAHAVLNCYARPGGLSSNEPAGPFSAASGRWGELRPLKRAQMRGDEGDAARGVLSVRSTRRGASPPFRNLPPGIVAPAKPALGRGTLHVGTRAVDRKSHRPALNVPLRARALPAPRTGGGLGGGRRGPLR